MATTTTAITCRRSSGPVISSFSPSSHKSISAVHSLTQPIKPKKTACMCSPTTHPGSFRCSLHKKVTPTVQIPSTYPSDRLRRLAMANSLARFGSVKGEIVNKAITAPIKPTSQRKRDVFQPKPSRLSVMSKAED